MVKKTGHITIAAGEFKAKCLGIMDDVAASRRPVTITKNGRPVARLVPIEAEQAEVFGCLRDEIVIVGDLLAPVAPARDWKALE